MSFHVHFVAELLLAQITLEVLDAGVDIHVSAEVPGRAESLLTVHAVEREDPTVGVHVQLVRRSVCEHLHADGADTRSVLERSMTCLIISNIRVSSKIIQGVSFLRIIEHDSYKYLDGHSIK